MVDSLGTHRVITSAYSDIHYVLAISTVCEMCRWFLFSVGGGLTRYTYSYNVCLFRYSLCTSYIHSLQDVSVVDSLGTHIVITSVYSDIHYVLAISSLRDVSVVDSLGTHIVITSVYSDIHYVLAISTVCEMWRWWTHSVHI